MQNDDALLPGAECGPMQIARLDMMRDFIAPLLRASIELGHVDSLFQTHAGVIGQTARCAAPSNTNGTQSCV